MKGIFKSFCNDHKFKQVGEKIIMIDVFEFESPLGIIGQLFNQLVLTNYLRNLLIERNNIIKNYAETDKWKLVLNS